MDQKHDGAANDMMPQAEEPPKSDAMEQAQKDAAEDRLDEGGYNG